MFEFNDFGTLKQDVTHTWDDLNKYWGISPKRRKLLKETLPGFKLLKEAGVKTVYLAGSFASIKKTPSDIDGVIDTSGDFDDSKIPEDILELLEDYCMDFYFDTTPTTYNGCPHIDFFRIGRNGENPGLIVLDITTVP